ncbi:MAG TPA: NAD(P)/FAD-dependent oxidoreductase [Candidatus Baltobacteraceae bacterium]|nr:NAD(P)/FAD-dependent oxidoreductase [Candidatus Baltobacteraceae bacterium]
MPRVVILGGGFAGLSAARELSQRRRAVRDLETVLVDRHNFMLFTPMLPEAATGAVETRHIMQPFRAQLRHVRFELGEAIAVDEQARSLTLTHPLTNQTSALEYDELIFALGSTPSTLGIEGVERCTLPLRTVDDALRLRNTVIGALEVAAQGNDLVERDRLLHFIVVGGGFTGVEAAGELSAFVRSLLRFYPALDPSLLGITLIQSEARLLPELPERFGKQAAHVLRERGIEIELGAEVEAVDSAGLTLKNGERHEARTIVWCAGAKPAPFVEHLGLRLSDRNAIETERDCSITAHPHLWAIGDCAAIPKRSGGVYAPLAQNATREGPLVARNVIARLRGRRTKPMRYERVGQMASLGDHWALVQLPGNRMLSGTAGWLLWRTYYLGRLKGAKSKTRVALDWALGLAFGPTLARLPLTEKPYAPSR